MSVKTDNEEDRSCKLLVADGTISFPSSISIMNSVTGS